MLQPVNTDPTVLTVTGVVLGGYSRQSVNADVVDMLSSLVEGFHVLTVATKGTRVGTYTTAWGESAQMVLGDDASLITWSDTPVTASLETNTLTTGAEGQEVGSITYTAGPNTVTVPVVLDAAIIPPDGWWRITHPGELHE
jgi:D-alanyl-D-alanine carboxypeptidase (penicillin-binding protein 5/6)